MSKQTAVELIFDNFNLLSDADFKTWMLNKYDELRAMEKEQIENAFENGMNAVSIHNLEQYYNETYGGDNAKSNS
jgi:hypothetical protein